MSGCQSKLKVQLKSGENLTIKNVDKKHTDLLFFNKEGQKSMFKRVDHIIYENLSGNSWKLHLIEMKSWVGVEKWKEIKGKFRASYLLAQGIAAMLGMNITETCLYTSYERVNLQPPSTMPSARRLPVGGLKIRPQDEWDGGECALNFGERIKFIHKPIQMVKSEGTGLTGELKELA